MRSKVPRDGQLGLYEAARVCDKGRSEKPPPLMLRYLYTLNGSDFVDKWADAAALALHELSLRQCDSARLQPLIGPVLLTSLAGVLRPTRPDPFIYRVKQVHLIATRPD